MHVKAKPDMSQEAKNKKKNNCQIAWGAWGTEGLAFIKTIGQKIQHLTGNNLATFYLFQSISMAVQRGNAASILGTVKPGKKLDEIYYLWW